jgi:hypothetical protein
VRGSSSCAVFAVCLVGSLCVLEVADDLCAIMSCRRGRLTRPVCAQPNPRRVEREFAPRAEPATITLKYMSRRSCVVLATHVFDGLDDWPTHIAFVSRATKCARLAATARAHAREDV